MKKLTLILLFVGAFFSSAFSVVSKDASSANSAMGNKISFKGNESGYILVSYFFLKSLTPIPGAYVKLNGTTVGYTDMNGECMVYCENGDEICVYDPSHNFTDYYQVPKEGDIIFPGTFPTGTEETD